MTPMEGTTGKRRSPKGKCVGYGIPITTNPGEELYASICTGKALGLLVVRVRIA